LCIVAPLGEDVSTCVLREQLDPARTLGIDTLQDCAGRLTLMRNPATGTALAVQAQALFCAGGQAVTLIDDSAGFIVQRVLATIVNIGCDIVQQGICSPADLDGAVVRGLGYPRGPLAWGDALGARRVLAILQNLQRSSGDPRYRPSPWLARRAQLGLSLLHVSN
jgi:3-hydroxybutyryl-CoA dehydrogenase